MAQALCHLPTLPSTYMEERGAGSIQWSPDQDKVPERPVKSHPELSQYGEEGHEAPC